MESTNHERLAGVVEFFQIRDDPVSTSSSESRAILNDDEARPNLCDEPSIFSPEAGFFSLEAGASTSKADVLTGETSTDDIHGNSICLQATGRELVHVVIAGDARPMLGEHPSAEWLDLAERDRSHPSSFEPKTETADTAEEIEDIHAPRSAIRIRDGEGGADALFKVLLRAGLCAIRVVKVANWHAVVLDLKAIAIAAEILRNPVPGVFMRHS